MKYNMVSRKFETGIHGLVIRLRLLVVSVMPIFSAAANDWRNRVTSIGKALLSPKTLAGLF